MAFTSKSQRILPGSLNFGGPGDKLPQNDAIANHNWRVDNTGSMRSRFYETGTLSQFPAPGEDLPTLEFQSPVSSLWLYNLDTPLPRRYVGDAKALFRVLPNPGGPFPVSVQKLADTDGKLISFANYQSYTWMMNRSVQGRDNGTAATLTTWVPLAPTTPALAAAVAGSPGLTGAYSYWISYYTADGFESNLGPKVDVTDAAQANNLTSIPISMDPTVFGRRVYRSGGGQDQLYLVARLADNTTTILSGEQMTDLAAAELGETHTLDHDPPPAAAGMVGTFYESLLAWSTAANPNRLFWSKTLQPGYWPGAALVTGNHVDVGDDDEAILRVTIKVNFCIIYKERSLWRLRGDPKTGTLERIAADIGLVGPAALCSRGGLDYFQGPEGLFSCNGDVITDVSLVKMGALFKGDQINYAPEVQLPHFSINLTAAVRSQSVMGQKNGRIYFTYADSSVTFANATLVYDIATDKWASDGRVFSCYFDEGPGYHFQGALGPYINNVEGTLVYPDGGLQLNYASHFDDQGAPRFAKLYGDLEIECDFAVAGDELVVTAYYNNGDYDSTSEVLGKIKGGFPRSQTVQFSQSQPSVPGSGTHAKNISIGLSGKVTGLVLIHAFHLKYQVEQRDALTFDTNAVQPWNGSWGQVIEFQLEAFTAGDVTWRLFSDSSGDLELQGNGTIPAGTLANRRSFGVPVGRIVEGRLFRLLLTCTKPMQIYAVRLYGRRLGVYIPAGGMFTTRELDFGTKRVKLFRKLEWDAEIDGALTVTVTTDMPRGWTARFAQAFSTAGIRAWVEQLFRSNTRGRAFRIDAVSSAATRLYSARVWYRAIGEAEPSDWAWGVIPLEPSEEIFAWITLPVDAPTSVSSALQLPSGG